jgi:hypothetical protein
MRDGPHLRATVSVRTSGLDKAKDSCDGATIGLAGNWLRAAERENYRILRMKGDDEIGI